MKKLTARQIVLLGLLVAMEIVLSRFFAISTPVVKISFAFLPVAIAAMWYGPVWGGACAAIADIIGTILFPVGAYFPGFTVTAALTGMIYGFMLYRQPEKVWRIMTAVVIINFGLNLGLDTFWLSIIMGESAFALLPVRLIKCLIMVPVQITVVRFVQHRLCNTRIACEQLF